MPAATTPMPTAAAVAAAAVTAKINAMDMTVQVPFSSLLHAMQLFCYIFIDFIGKAVRFVYFIITMFKDIIVFDHITILFSGKYL